MLGNPSENSHQSQSRGDFQRVNPKSSPAFKRHSRRWSIAIILACIQVATHTIVPKSAPHLGYSSLIFLLV